MACNDVSNWKKWKQTGSTCDNGKNAEKWGDPSQPWTWTASSVLWRGKDAGSKHGPVGEKEKDCEEPERGVVRKEGKERISSSIRPLPPSPLPVDVPEEGEESEVNEGAVGSRQPSRTPPGHG